jgi:hypothetical protein
LRRKEAGSQGLDERCLEDVAERNPVAEAKECLEGGVDQAGLGSCVEDLLTELEDLGEF